MKKLILFIAFMAFALLGYGQYTITNEGNNIKVASTTESISFSKEGLIFQYISPRLYFISNDKLYPFLWTEIDSPSYSTIDSLYNAVASWLPSMTYTSMTADTITDGVATLTGGNWTGINLMAVDTITATGILKSQGLTFTDPGTSKNSAIFTMTADNSTVNQTGTMFLAYGADPYLRISAPVPSGTARPIMDLHDEDITLFDGSTDVDYTVTFNGKSHDGIITYMEDEDRFDFDNAVTVMGALTGGSFTDGTLSISAGSITGGNLASFDTITANVFSGEDDPIYATDSAKIVWFQDTLTKIASQYDLTSYEPVQTKGNLTEGITGLEFSATRQVIGGTAQLNLTTGYVIPTTTEESNWNSAYGWGNHAGAGYLTGNQSITLSGDASGTGTTAITVAVADDSHAHTIANVDFLQDSLTAMVFWVDTSSKIASQFDIIDMVNWADTTAAGGVGVATAYDLSQIVTGWTIVAGTPDTIYENDSAVVKLNNWLMTDYITDGSKVDDEEGLPLNVGNTMLGYGAFVKDSRLGDMAQLSTFIGYQAGYDADTVAYSTFLGKSAGQESTNATNSTFLGNRAGQESTNAAYSTFLGNRAGQESTNAAYSTFLGIDAGYQSDSATGSTFLGIDAGSASNYATNSTFLGYSAGYQSDSATGSTFLGIDAGSASNYADYSTFLGYKAGYQSDSISDSYFYGSYTGIKSNLLDEMILIGDSVGYQQSGLSHQIWIDDSPTSTPLILGDFANDVLTVNGIVEIPGDGSPKFRLYVIADTLCSVRVGIDTVRIHPPRP